MSEHRLPKITLWRAIVAIIFAAGAYAAYARFALGFQSSTNLVDAQPWGLWVGLGVPAGLAATIMAVFLCNRSLKTRVNPTILTELGQVIVPLLYVYAIFRAIDLYTAGASSYLFMWREESLLFWVEIALFVLAPIILLTQERIRANPQYLYWTCALVVMGFMTNRLNVSITAFQRFSGVYYVPKWTEFALTLATVTAVVVAFHYAVVYLEILPKGPKQRTPLAKKWIAGAATA